MRIAPFGPKDMFLAPLCLLFFPAPLALAPQGGHGGPPPPPPPPPPPCEEQEPPAPPRSPSLELPEYRPVDAFPAKDPTAGTGPPVLNPGAFASRAAGADPSRWQAATALPVLDERSWQGWWERNRGEFLPAPRPEVGLVLPALTGDEESRRASFLRLARAGLEAEAGIGSPCRSAALLALAQLGDGRGRVADCVSLLSGRREDARMAVLALGFIRSPEALRVLEGLLRDDQAARLWCGGGPRVPDDLRAWSAIAHGVFGARSDRPSLSPLVARQLVAFLEDAGGEDPMIQAACVTAIGGMDLRRSADLGGRLLALLEERNRPASVRSLLPVVTARIAVEADDEPFRAAVVQWCLRSLVDRSVAAGLRQGCVQALGRLTRPSDPFAGRVVGALRDGVERDPNGLAGDLALIALARIAAADGPTGSLAAPLILPLLEQELLQGSGQRRPWAALALGLTVRWSRERGHAAFDAAAAQPLVSAFQADRSPSTRSAVALGLALAEAPSAGPLLQEALARSADPAFLGPCAVALGMLGVTECHDRLVDLMAARGVSSRFTRQLALALGLLGRSEGVVDLAGWLEPNPRGSLQRLSAVNAALREVGDGRCLGALLSYLGSDEALVQAKREVCLTLAAVGAPEGRLLRQGLAQVGHPPAILAAWGQPGAPLSAL